MPGVVEVFHAHMTSHVYPMHTHEAWTLLIVDDGMIRYDLHDHEHGAMDRLVTRLPPQVPHNGRAATSAGPSTPLGGLPSITPSTPRPCSLRATITSTGLAVAQKIETPSGMTRIRPSTLMG